MKWALGLMSGTSMDGIDVALIRTDGEMQVERGPAITFPYSEEHRQMVREAVQHAVHCSNAQSRPGRLMETERVLTELNAAAVSAFLRKTGFERQNVDVIGFHGQTVLHRPEDRLTVQLGDGGLLAEFTRCPVVYDLRSDDVRAGGQGAPLAPVYHRALAAGIAARPLGFLNIGGVANVTWIGDDGRLMAFDTGPGNALVDDWVRVKGGIRFDDGGALAGRGTVSAVDVARFLEHPFFDRPPPKSLDRQAFHNIAVEGLSLEDGAATLTELTVEAIARGLAWLPAPPVAWVVAGGGRHNQAMMQRLQARLRVPVEPAERYGIDSDSVEAEAWAYLAVRAMAGLEITYPETTGAPRPMSGGRLAPFARKPSDT